MRKVVAVYPFRGTTRQLMVCDDGTTWEHVEKDNKIVVEQHARATIPQPEAIRRAAAEAVAGE